MNPEVNRTARKVQSAGGDDRGRVLPFRAPPGRPRHPCRHGNDDLPIDDLKKFSEGSAPEPDDYRHRMVTNAAAVVFVSILAVIGIWLANSMAQLRKNEDCVLRGLPNCSSIELPVARR
jgi:hypothetical protein